VTTSRLTDWDRRTITKARKLAALNGTDAYRAHTGEDDGDMARAVALGEAQALLEQLADIAERLGAADVTEAGDD
jgi:hypothetical protein